MVMPVGVISPRDHHTAAAVHADAGDGSGRVAGGQAVGSHLQHVEAAVGGEVEVEDIGKAFGRPPSLPGSTRQTLAAPAGKGRPSVARRSTHRRPDDDRGRGTACRIMLPVPGGNSIIRSGRQPRC